LVICGGGPAGCATALFLWHSAPELRQRILLIDKAEFPREKICAGAIGGRADRLLEAIGVRVVVPSVEVRGLGVRTGAGELVERMATSIGRVVRRVEYDAALLDEVRGRGIAVRTGVELRSMTRESGALCLETNAGAIRCGVLVGADGVGSRVRRLLGAPRGHYYAQAVEVDTPLLPTEDDDVLWFDLRDATSTGYLWTFPTMVSGELLACRGAYRLVRGGLVDDGHDVGVSLSSALSRVGVARDLPFKRFAQRGLALHEPCGSDGVLLVGEAAGIDPVLGEGIAQAIFYGRAAGEYLANALRRRDYRFSDYRGAIQRSRVGLDLRIRAYALPWVYGRTRPVAEQWLRSSRSLARAGMSYFAGDRVSRLDLVRAAFDLISACLHRQKATFSRRGRCRTPRHNRARGSRHPNVR
jgi:flavin-dependent dehydrogenase